MFDQPVIAPAAEHRALRAEPVGDEFERGVAIIIHSAHEPRGAGPFDARRIEPGRDRAEEIFRLARQKIVDHRGGLDMRPVARILAVEDAQRIARQAVLAVFRKRALHALEMLHQRVAPGIAARAIAERIELERDAPIVFGANAEFVEQLVRHHQQFDIGLRFARADDLGIDLVELAIAPLLRTLVTK